MRCVSTSFGCRVNPAICVQGASSAESANVSFYEPTRVFKFMCNLLGLRGSPGVEKQSRSFS